MEDKKEMQQMSLLDEIDKEIESELGLDKISPPPEYVAEAATSRKPFRITDFDQPRDKEMAVITHAKKLSEYLFVITEKSPKKFRWNIVDRLLNISTDVIEFLYMANYGKEVEERLLWQKKAMIALNMLDFYAETARTKQAINTRQLTIIAKQIFETQKLLRGWAKSTKTKK